MFNPWKEKRFTVTLSRAAHDRLRKLMKINNEDMSSLVRHALQVYDFLLMKSSEGCSLTLTIVSQDGERKELPVFKEEGFLTLIKGGKE